MAPEPDNLVLELLRAIRTDVTSIREDSREIKSRLASLESGFAGMKRDHAGFYGDLADHHSRYDRLADRIERIEKRLQITEG